MMASCFGLTATNLYKIRSVFARYPQVEKAVLYGSRAKGNYKNGSDIDLTLYGDDLTHNNLLAMLNNIDDLLLPYMIDLSIFKMLDHEKLREHIEQVGLLFYERGSTGGK